MKRGRTAILLSVAGLLLLGGCLGEPGVDERWTRLDVLEILPPAGELEAGASVTIRVRGTVTYRAILTGTVALEIRATETAIPLDGGDRLAMADAVGRILASSDLLASETRSVTGFDHLIQEFDVTMDAALPADGAAFLVFYLGEEERVAMPSGEEMILVRPFASEAKRILPAGVLLVDAGE
jgi:hypothetical protein